jgi:RNA-directed DNA polymerase
MRHGDRKSDTDIVPEKLPNNAGGPVAEAVEGREVAEGNAPERTACRTQGRESASSALGRVRDAARRDKKLQFTALLPHVYAIGRLRYAYYALKREAAAGVDGETWEHYGEQLEAHLTDLSPRL